MLRALGAADVVGQRSRDFSPSGRRWFHASHLRPVSPVLTPPLPLVLSDAVTAGPAPCAGHPAVDKGRRRAGAESSGERKGGQARRTGWAPRGISWWWRGRRGPHHHTPIRETEGEEKSCRLVSSVSGLRRPPPPRKRRTPDGGRRARRQSRHFSAPRHTQHRVAPVAGRQAGRSPPSPSPAAPPRDGLSRRPAPAPAEIPAESRRRAPDLGFAAAGRLPPLSLRANTRTGHLHLKMMMGLLAFENNQGLWNGGYYSQFFGIGGVMVTVAILWLSTGYFGGIGAPFAPYFWPYLGQVPKKKERQRPVRVYMDGCFDLMHYGHANALRQAKLLGDQLVVGVVSDEEIVANKGPPVLSMEERLTLVSGLKWVDEVIPNAPYEITEEFMNTLFSKYNIDYIIHGDDPCLLPDGTDAYALAKKAGRYKQIRRTEGVSSTDIVGRILQTFKHKEAVNENAGVESCDQMKTQLSNFLPTSRRIMQFSNGQAPSPGARVVYIDGAFDLFHAGHVEILRSARQLGDFLLVGVHDDQSIREKRGYPPIMHLHERTLGVLACRYVDEVIIGAPWEVSRDMITTFNISYVVHGTVTEGGSASEVDPYALPKSMGIFQVVTSPKTITSVSVATRIIDNHEAYKKRNLKKKVSEDKYYTQKKFVYGD